MTRDWTEREIAAFVDGALDDPADAERIARAIETDAEARALSDRIAASNSLLREAFGTPMEQEVPPSIAAVLTNDARRVGRLPRRRPVPGFAPTALAASVALLIGLGLGATLAPQVLNPAKTVIGLGVGGPDDALAQALETLPSGASSPTGVRPMLTFRDATGRPCREFEVVGALPSDLEFGLACRIGDGTWEVPILVAAPANPLDPGGFEPASGAVGDALSAMLDALGAGPALTPDAEAALLASRWNGSPSKKTHPARREGE